MVIATKWSGVVFAEKRKVFEVTRELVCAINKVQAEAPSSDAAYCFLEKIRWTVGESNPRSSNANAMYYHYTNGPIWWV
jgi:hypothetical protein